MRTFEDTCGSVPLVVIEGEIDHSNMQEFARAVQEAPRRDDNESILLDMAEVSYIDSGGLSVIYSILHSLGDGAFLGVIAPRSPVLRILKVGGVTGHPSFRVFGDRSRACDAVSPTTEVGRKGP